MEVVELDAAEVVIPEECLPGPDGAGAAAGLPWYRQPLPLWTQVFRFLPVFLLSVLVLAAALLVTNARMPNPQEVRPLPDLLFDAFPKVGWLETGTDVVIAVLNVMTVYVLFKVFLLERKERGCQDLRVPFNVPYLSKALNAVLFHVFDSGARPFPLKGCYLIAAIRFLTVYTVLMLYRAPVIMMTSYPATDNHCQHPVPIERPILNMVLTLVTLGSGAIHCGDLMFSGHTLILCITTSLLWSYSPYVHRWALRVVAPLLLLFSFYCIVASRSHYTDDILVAAYATFVTYMVIEHSPDGAPWQLQLAIRWWPCPGRNHRAPGTTPATLQPPTEVVILQDEGPTREDADAMKNDDIL